MQPIIPVVRQEPFDDPTYLFELKLDGFRGIADTVNGRMLSKNGNRLGRFERLLEGLPPGYVFDGEIVALDEDGRPRFNDLLFGRREPVYVASARRYYGVIANETDYSPARLGRRSSFRLPGAGTKQRVWHLRQFARMPAAARRFGQRFNEVRRTLRQPSAKERGACWPSAFSRSAQ
jgi:hypothetical protein